MTSRETEQTRRDISEGFEFVRFLIKHPKALKSVRNGSEIRILPAACSAAARPRHWPRGVQPFTTQTIFHSYP
jgi:hypothetical protein